LIRIPEPGRFELRLPDGAANAYLLPAAILAAGLDGVVNGRDPGPRRDINMYTHGHLAADAPALPRNLLEALHELDRSALLRDALGDAFVDAYLKLRRAEWDAYASHLTSWETDTTFDC
jgi:glutamine synthetase